MSSLEAAQRGLKEAVLSIVTGTVAPDHILWGGQSLPRDASPLVVVNNLGAPRMLPTDARDQESTIELPTQATISDAGAGTPAFRGFALRLQDFDFFATTLAGIKAEIDLWTRDITTVMPGSDIVLTGSKIWGLSAPPGSRISIVEDVTDFFVQQVAYRETDLDLRVYVRPQGDVVTTPLASSAIEIIRLIHTRLTSIAIREKLGSRGVSLLLPLGGPLNISGLAGPDWESAAIFNFSITQTFVEQQVQDQITSVIIADLQGATQ